MKIIGLEEHVVVPELLAAWSSIPGFQQTTEKGFGDARIAQRLRNVSDRRISDMDDQGIDVQVLSLTTPGVHNLSPADSVVVAREANEALAEIVAKNTQRFQAFAAIPTPAPESAADELERAIVKLGFRGAMLNGRTGNKSADAPQFDSLYEAAERLDSPLYLHPQVPTRAICEGYYSGFSSQVDSVFASFGLGWYYETGVQLLRMIFSGVFDRHPRLQVIVGHWGKVVLFLLEHTAKMESTGLHLERPLADYFRENVWITGSGLLSERYLRWTVEVVGVERIMYSTDYPFMDTSGGKARSFLEHLPLTEIEKASIAAGNWERLTAGSKLAL